MRAGRSPYQPQPRVRAAAAAPAGAALPHSRSCPLPARASASSPPMPLFLLLLLVLLLLLEDAGAQQGEWFPGKAGARGEPAGRQGCGPRAESDARRGGAGCLPRVGSPGPALARLSGKAGISLLSPQRGAAVLFFFLARPFIFLKRGERDPAIKAPFLVLDCFSRENLWGRKKDGLET